MNFFPEISTEIKDIATLEVQANMGQAVTSDVTWLPPDSVALRN